MSTIIRSIPAGILAAVLTAIIPLQVFSAQNDAEQLKAEAVAIVKKFGGALKPQLKQAMQQGGPVHAIDVCSKKAPEIAAQLSRETGWQVKRVSLKPRNSRTAVPDDWERRALERFDQRQAGGESADTMAFAETTGQRFRFIKAQAVEDICLNCHGDTLAPDVEQALRSYYPNDAATGYSLGQIRGAFSLSKKL